MIVADSNLIAYLLIPGDKTVIADQVFLKDAEWVVPLICKSELRNILTLYMRHENMPLHQAQSSIEKAEELWRDHEYSVPSMDVLELTHQHKITAYDAEFVVLAQNMDIPLVTFDKAVKKTFPKTAIDPADFLRS